jgi:hypothetical protein
MVVSAQYSDSIVLAAKIPAANPTTVTPATSQRKRRTAAIARGQSSPPMAGGAARPGTSSLAGRESPAATFPE